MRKGKCLEVCLNALKGLRESCFRLSLPGCHCCNFLLKLGHRRQEVLGSISQSILLRHGKRGAKAREGGVQNDKELLGEVNFRSRQEKPCEAEPVLLGDPFLLLGRPGSLRDAWEVCREFLSIIIKVESYNTQTCREFLREKDRDSPTSEHRYPQTLSKLTETKNITERTLGQVQKK